MSRKIKLKRILAFTLVLVMLFCSGMTSVYAAEGDLSGDGTQGTGSQQVSTAGTSGGDGQASSSAESPSDPVVNPVTPGTDPATPGTDPTNPGTDPINTTPVDAENSAADQTLTAVIYTDDSMATVADDETVITVAGSLPEGGYITAWPVSVTIDGMQVFAAYDITIRNSDGSAFQPDEATGEPVRVNINTPRLDNVDEVSVYHIEPSGDDTSLTSADPSFIDATSVTVNPAVEDSVPATVADTSVTATKVADSVAVEESAVQFDAESFSIYVVVNSAYKYANTEDTAYELKVGSTVRLYSDNYSSGSWSVQKMITSGVYGPTSDISLTNYYRFCDAKILAKAAPGSIYRVVNGSGPESSYFYIKIIQDPTVTISPSIETTGCLNAKITDKYGKEVTDPVGSGYTLTWSKDGSPITDPDGLRGLLLKGGQSVNVALTNGGLATYTLTVTDASGTVGTATYTVPYAMQLQNGSFEIPNNSNVTVNGQTGLMVQYPYDYSGLIWNTTGRGSGAKIHHDIEIIRPRAFNENGNALSEYGISTTDANPTADGDQFAELNCEASGALYQDVLTAPGSNLFWSLYHRARARGATNASSVIDKMSVVVMSAKQAEDFTNQGYLNKLIEAVDNGGPCIINGVQHDISSVKVWHINTDNATQWYYHDNVESAYSVSSGQYLTRFFFVAGDTFTGDQAIGNFLDKVTFSKDIPYTIEYYVNGTKETYTDSSTVDPSSNLVDATTATHYGTLRSQYSLTGTTLGYGSDDGNYHAYGSTSWYVRDEKTTLRLYFVDKPAVTVYKTFSGLTADAIPAAGYTVTFKLSKGGEPDRFTTIKIDKDFVAGTPYIASFSGVTNGSYTITESVPDASGYSLTGVQGRTASGTLTDITSSKAVSFTVGGTSTSVYFTNTYTYTQEATPDVPYLTVRKTFSGITGDMLTSLMQTASSNQSYSIQLIPSGEATHAYTLLLSDAIRSGMTLTWNVEGLTAGSYTVSETGANTLFDNYSMIGSTGFGAVTTAVPTLTYQSSVDKTTNCNQTQFSVGNAVNLIVIKLTANNGYFVWTDQALSAGERQAVAAIINDNDSIGFSPNITDVDTQVAFFSGNDLIQNGFSFRGGTIKYDPSSGQLTMHASSQWSQFACGTYSGTTVPEIAVTNEYQQGYTLPITGGIGTIWFQAIGTVLLAGGAAGLWMELSRGKKRAVRCFPRKTQQGKQIL